MKKYLLVSLLAVLALFCTSCAPDPAGTPAPSATAEAAVFPSPKATPTSTPSRSQSNDTSYIVRSPSEAVKERGRELLAEYDVRYDETIYFPDENGQVYKTHGAVPLTDASEVRSLYPGWPVPDTLGEYEFADFTLYTERTSAVFPNSVPLPEPGTIEVFEEPMPVQYYLCYRKGGTQFRLSVWPLAEMEHVGDVVVYPSIGGAPWPLHPECDFLPASELWDEEKQDYVKVEDELVFDALLIPAVSDGEHAFFIHKMEGADCLESKTIPFTEEEAKSIYDAVRAGF